MPMTPQLPDESPGVAQPNIGRAAGSIVRSVTGAGRPMGSWTGLPDPYGAAVSGGLWGAGAGAVYHGLKNRLIPWLRGERVPKEKKIITPLLLGGLLGLGTGALVKGASSYGYDPMSDVGRLILVILQDPNLTESEKQNALAQLRRMTQSQVKALLLSTAGGAVSGAILAAMLGGGPAGMPAGAFTGGVFGHLAGRNIF